MAQADGANAATRPFTITQIACVMLIAVMSSLVVLLQPLLLAPLADEGRLTLQEIGRTAMLEAMGIAIAIVIAGALLEPRRLRILVLAALTTAVAANAASVFVSHEMILVVRFVSGLSIGVLLWVWTGLLTRAELPSRLVGIFLVLQASGALLVSYLLSTYLVPRLGVSSGYGCLAVTSAMALFLAIGVPSQYAPAANAHGQSSRLPRGRGLVGLLAIFLHMAAIMAFWVYVVPLGKEKGLTPQFVNLTASVALASQIAGAFCAAIFARLPAKPTLLWSLLASIVGVLVVGMGTHPMVFLAGCTLIVFLWMFAPAYQMPYLLALDPSGRAGIQMIAAQLFGMSAGPAIVSMLVRSDEVSASLWVSGGFYATAAVVIVASSVLRPVREAGLVIARES